MRLLSAILPLVLTAAALAEKPAALSPKEIAAGRIMLFDGETTYGWKVEGDAKIAEGVLKLGGPKTTTLTSTSEFPRGNVIWSFRHTGQNQATMTWRGEKRNLSATKNNSWVKETYEPGSLGWSPIRLTVPPGTELEIRSFVFEPILLEPLFSGVDLKGWNNITATTNGPNRNSPSRRRAGSMSRMAPAICKPNSNSTTSCCNSNASATASNSTAAFSFAACRGNIRMATKPRSTTVS